MILHLHIKIKFFFQEKVNRPRGGRGHFMAPTAASKSRALNAKNGKCLQINNNKQKKKSENVL